MLFLDARAARVTWTVLVFAAAIAVIYTLRRILLLTAFALFFAYLIFPLVSLVQQLAPLRRRRTAAIALVYLILLLGLAGAGLSIAPRLSREVATLATKVPEVSQQLQSGTLVGRVLEGRGWKEEPVREIEATISAHAQEIIAYAQQTLARLLTWLASAWMIVLLPIFAFFILKDAERLAAAVDRLIEDRRKRELWRDIVEDLHRLLGQYVRALIALTVITFVVWTGVFFVAGVPYPLVLAVVGGALEFIPVVGPILAAITVIAVGLFSGYAHPWLLIAFILIWRAIQDYGTSPLVMGRGIEIHPALVIFGVIAGGEIGGPAGMFLSVPVIAALRVVWHRLRAFERLAARATRAGSPDPR